MVLEELFLYSSTIDIGTYLKDTMNITLGLRALSLLAFVATSTAAIVAPELLGGADSFDAIGAVMAVSHP